MYGTVYCRHPLNMVTAVRKTQTFYVTLVKPEGNTSERRQRGRVVRALDLQFGGTKFKSCPDR